MRITHVFKETSNSANAMRWDYEHYNRSRDIYDAYVKPSCAKVNSWLSIKLAYEKPSYAKISAWDAIVYDYKANDGLHAIQVGRQFKSLQYNNDVRVTGSSSHFFSTIASFTDTETNEIWLVKETHVNTYACKL